MMIRLMMMPLTMIRYADDAAEDSAALSCWFRYAYAICYARLCMPPPLRFLAATPLFRLELRRCRFFVAMSAPYDTFTLITD